MSEMVIPTVKPEVVFIEDLLDEISQGVLRLPAFQRPFVWKPQDMIDLFSSIAKGYPIGAPLLWDASEEYESSQNVGPIGIPTIKGRSITYILDGQQRLTTLFACLRLGVDALRDGDMDNWKWWIFYDLSKKEFVHCKKSKMPAYYFPIRAALKTVDFLVAARQIASDCENADGFIAEAEVLAQKLKSYKLAVNRIRGGNLGQAVEIFSLLNSMGAPMKPDQMVSALTYKGGNQPHLANHIDSLLDRLGGYHFDGVSRMTVLQSIFAVAGIRIHKTNWVDLSKDLGDKLSDTLRKAEPAIENAVQFLFDVLGVPGSLLLPYSNQLFLLSVFFNIQPKPTAEQTQTLRKWFWSTSFNGWFAGANSTSINNAIKEMEQFARSEVDVFNEMSAEEAARPFPTRFDMRSARIRAMLLFQLQLKPLDPGTGKPLFIPQIVSEYRQWFYVFTKGDLASHPANRILIPKTMRKSVKTQLCEIPENFRTQVLDSYGITQKAFEALISDDAEGFITARGERLVELERDFMTELNITPPSEPFGEVEIDTDQN